MKLLTTSVIVVIVVGIVVCVMGPFNAYAEVAVSGAAPVELVAPPDLLNFVEEPYAYDLIVEVNAAAAEYGVPVELCWEVIRAESGFHHVKPNGELQRSHCNALGICQIIPDGMAIKKRHNVRDRADNIRCMADILTYALYERGYSLEHALGWYNTGRPVTNSYARRVAKAYRSWVEQKGGTPL